jgi:hypothetical protein
VPLFAQTLKRSVWVAHSFIENGVRQYGTPVLHKWNCRGLNMGVGMMMFGPSYIDYRKVVTDNSEIVDIAQFDRAWIDKIPSDPTDTLATDANFYVFSVVPGVSGVAEISFKRLSQDASENTIS